MTDKPESDGKIDGFGARVAALRDQRGMTQRQLGAATGLDQGTISRLERGEMENPTMSTVRSLANALGVTIADLAGEAPEPPESHVEPIEDEALSVADQALRAMQAAHGLDPATTRRLRERLEQVQFSTGARLSTVASFLEDELIAMKAERRPKVEDRAEAVKRELPANMAKFDRSGGKKKSR